MAIDFSKIQLISSASSNKVLSQNIGSFTVAALSGAGETTSSVTIAHSFGSDNLLFQVTAYGTFASGPARLPWGSGDNRIFLYASVDNTNLYITAVSSDTGGSGSPSFTVNYAYRILIP